MFRALAAFSGSSGGSTNSEGFTDHSEYVVKQTNTFTKQYPNVYPTGLTNKDVLSSAGLGLKTWDPNTDKAQHAI